jgi:hypothetical protein
MNKDFLVAFSAHCIGGTNFCVAKQEERTNAPCRQIAEPSVTGNSAAVTGPWQEMAAAHPIEDKA